MTTWLAGAGLAVAVFFVYPLTFSSTPVSDTFTWLHTIDTADFEMMVLAGHALPLYVHFVLKRLLTWLGTPVPTLTIIHTVNAGLAAVGTLLFYNLTPNPFTLRRINMVEPSRGADPVTYDDFDRFLARLKDRYVLVPVASYWEEAKIPLVLYGRRFETIWEIKKAS